jgi:hypothetical protein
MMIGIPTPTCEPSDNTPDDTCTGLPAGVGGAVELGAVLDAPDEPPAGALAVRVTVSVGPGVVAEVHAETPSAATTTAAVRASTARGRRLEKAEVTATA